MYVILYMKLRKYLSDLFINKLCVYLWACAAWVQTFVKAKFRIGSQSPTLEFQAAVRIQLQRPGRAADTLNCWAVSPAPTCLTSVSKFTFKRHTFYINPVFLKLIYFVLLIIECQTLSDINREEVHLAYISGEWEVQTVWQYHLGGHTVAVKWRTPPHEKGKERTR